MTRTVYDLATPAADFAPWSGAPLRSLVVCGHMRSGSTLLGEALYFAGGFGCPIEYFHAGFRPSLEQAWGVYGSADYLRAVYRRRTDPTGTFGVKLFWTDVLVLCAQRFPERAELFERDLDAEPEAARQVYALVGALFAEIFPKPTFVWVERRDRLRGAVSHAIAAQTQVWRRIPLVNDNAPLREPEFDYERICQMYAWAASSAARWDGLFRGLGVSPYRVAYEDLLNAYDATVGGLLAHLGASNTRPLPAPRMQRQASAVSERFVARFLREHERRTADGASAVPVDRPEPASSVRA